MRHRVSSSSTNSSVGSLCRRGTAPFLLAVVLAFGCGDKGGKTEITGKVTLGGQPVAGEIVFVYADNKEMLCPLSADGKYMIVDAPVGAVKVYIKPPLTAGGGLIAPPKTGSDIPKDVPSAAASGVPAPAKYQAVGTSGLTYEVKAGKQTFDIPLQ